MIKSVKCSVRDPPDVDSNLAHLFEKFTGCRLSVELDRFGFCHSMTDRADSTLESGPMVLFSDIPTMDLLLRQVDQLQDSVDDDILNMLMEENFLLEKNIESGRQKLIAFSHILREAFEGYVVLKAYLENLDKATRTISEEWAKTIFHHDTFRPIDSEDQKTELVSDV